MESQPASPRRVWVADVGLAWQEQVLDRLRGRRRCPLLQSLMMDPALDGRRVEQDVQRLVGGTGRRLTRNVVGIHPRRQSLTDYFERGAAQATHILAHAQPHETLLELGGGIGRLGRAIAPHVHRLVSVDATPLATTYGPRLSPGIEFRGLDDLPESPDFDGAYAVGAFLHLPPEGQRRAIEYVHRRLKPGGWFLVDVRLATPAADARAGSDAAGTTTPDEFRSSYESLFSARRVPLFNSGFLLRRKTTGETPASAVDGRYALNEASIVFDVLEGEVVVVNLDNGSYYILEGIASAIWQMLVASAAVPRIAATLSVHYPEEAGALPSLVSDFVAQLAQESLIVPATGLESLAPAFDEDRLGHAPLPFTPPVMFRYTDMQALIQMDPIREYDETGWPRRPPRPPAPSA